MTKLGRSGCPKLGRLLNKNILYNHHSRFDRSKAFFVSLYQNVYFYLAYILIFGLFEFVHKFCSAEYIISKFVLINQRLYFSTSSPRPVTVRGPRDAKGILKEGGRDQLLSKRLILYYTKALDPHP